ncbi:MAG: hypothetical protein LQ350_004190 [Teloschistes chrysophthalmus]|nr:MAG: hypothetical protein LQ350_004190 [Niorma chrysophthalma]
MAAEEVPPGLRIPTVTLADLQDFHDRHFGVITRSVVPAQDAKWDVEESGQGQEQEADLGYYPDGVKRTLTDEQIAMFRHSEISRLLRQRQLQKENAMVDEEASDPSATMRLPSGSSPQQVESSGIENPGLAASVEAKGTTIQASKKRQIDHDGRKRGRDTAPPTSRRQARELDDVTGSIDVLDYGEDSYIKPAKRAVAGRTQVSYAELDEVDTSTTIPEMSPRRAEGRKIWWPAIG